MSSLATISTDLRRISYWKAQGRNEIADQFLKSSLEKNEFLDYTIGRWSLKDVLEKIIELDNKRAAELAMMTSVILKSKHEINSSLAG